MLQDLQNLTTSQIKTKVYSTFTGEAGGMLKPLLTGAGKVGLGSWNDSGSLLSNTRGLGPDQYRPFSLSGGFINSRVNAVKSLLNIFLAVPAAFTGIQALSDERRVAAGMTLKPTETSAEHDIQAKLSGTGSVLSGIQLAAGFLPGGVFAKIARSALITTASMGTHLAAFLWKPVVETASSPVNQTRLGRVAAWIFPRGHDGHILRDQSSGASKLYREITLRLQEADRRNGIQNYQNTGDQDYINTFFGFSNPGRQNYSFSA